MSNTTLRKLHQQKKPGHRWRRLPASMRQKPQ
ncbi:hypothetical protein HDF11_005366 [Tunturiibacter psychrotolerans]